MKRLLTIILTAIILLSTFSFTACSNSKSGDDTDNIKVQLINVHGLDTYDVKNAMTDAEKSRITIDTWFKFTSVATNRAFAFDSSIIDLADIHREYFIVEGIFEDEVVYKGKLDFYDIENDGVVWCEISEYTVGAVRTDAPSSIQYQYEYEEFYEGEALTAEPLTPRYWRFAYYTIMPFHSKEYYLEFTDDKTMFEIGYIRKATYDIESWHFNPDTMEHLLGQYAPYRARINVRYFGCGGNVSSTGAELNTPQSLTFRMQDILEKFEILGRHGEGHGNYWYLVGTCHADGNPYRVRYFFQYIDIQQY